MNYGRITFFAKKTSIKKNFGSKYFRWIFKGQNAVTCLHVIV